MNQPALDWIISTTSASIIYLAQKHLLNLPATDAQMLKSRKLIAESQVIREMTSHQTPEGNWMHEHSYYTPKYTSTHWSMLLLHELALDENHQAYQRGAQYMLHTTLPYLKERQVQYKTPGFSCLWGNILRYAWAVSHLRADAQPILDYITHDVINNLCACPYNEQRPCAWGLIRSLWGLAAIPANLRTPSTLQAIESGVTFILKDYDLTQANYPRPEQAKIHPLWFGLNFPLFYQTDILFTLRVLAELCQLHQPEAQPALDWLEDKQNKQGVWRGSHPFRQRTWKHLANGEDAHRWASLFALTILKSAGRVD